MSADSNRAASNRAASNQADTGRAISCREATADDFPILVNWYGQLNTYFYQMGYRLPHPENVGQIWLESFQRTLGRFSNVFIAELEGDPVGFMLCRLKRVPAHMGGVMVGEISDVWIETEARRLGIGERLSRLALAWLRENDAHSVEVQILKDNEGSWKMFERLGFQLEFRAVRLLWDEYIEEDA